MSHDDYPNDPPAAAPPHPDAIPVSSRARSGPPETEDLIRRVVDLVSAARPMPLSSSAMVN